MVIIVPKQKLCMLGGILCDANGLVKGRNSLWIFFMFIFMPNFYLSKKSFSIIVFY